MHIPFDIFDYRWFGTSSLKWYHIDYRYYDTNIISRK